MGSLFAGIGGFDLGFERAGFQTVWQVEINEWCRRVLAKNFPHAQRYADIRECCGIQGEHVCGRACHLAPVDVLCGGFPCQDISYAGLGAGLAGERSGLVTEAIRLIDELRPSFALLENVAALLARGLDTVLGLLTEIGYDAEWEVVPAWLFGLAHRRERVWILAYPKLEGRSRLLHGIERQRSEEVVSRRQADSLGACRRTLQRLEQRHGEPALLRSANGVPHLVDRLGGLGNAVVPQIPELYARRIVELLQERAA